MIHRKLLDMYSRVRKNKKQAFAVKMTALTLMTGLVSWVSTTSVNTASMLTISEVRAEEMQVEIEPISVDLSVKEDTQADVKEAQENLAHTATEQPVVENHVTSDAYAQVAYQPASAPVAQYQANTAYPTVLANGNTAGAIGAEAAAQMAARTGVPQATWEYIIARESNGNPNVANASGASGLFQTMPGWGSTATVQDQINAAVNAYNNQGLAAWGM